MKFRRCFISTLLATATSLGVYAQLPYGGCWHPHDIKSRSPETDSAAKFNRSRVPLATRFRYVANVLAVSCTDMPSDVLAVAGAPLAPAADAVPVAYYNV